MGIFGYPAGQLSRVFLVPSATFRLIHEDISVAMRQVFVSSKNIPGLESFQSQVQRSFLIVKFQKMHCWCRKRILEYILPSVYKEEPACT